MNWKHEVKIKHLLTDEEDWESVQKNMNEIADVLGQSPYFVMFNYKKFRSIPKGDEVFGPLDYANKLLSRMYDFADAHGIWVD